MTVTRHQGDMFMLFDEDTSYDLLVVTTNTTKKSRNGKILSSPGPLGKGTALQAAHRYPWLQSWWSGRVRDHILLRFVARPLILGQPCSRWIGCLVTKEIWWQPSTLPLTASSLEALQTWLSLHSFIRRVLLPLPGAGAGQLDPAVAWKLVDSLLDPPGTFTVCTLPDK